MIIQQLFMFLFPLRLAAQDEVSNGMNSFVEKKIFICAALFWAKNRSQAFDVHQSSLSNGTLVL